MHLPACAGCCGAERAGFGRESGRPDGMASRTASGVETDGSSVLPALPWFLPAALPLCLSSKSPPAPRLPFSPPTPSKILKFQFNIKEKH